jgi:opacity protein-like surface antigen
MLATRGCARLVLALEGDIDYVDVKGTANSAICAICTFENTWLGNLRGRVGYSFGQWLPYLTGGGARGKRFPAARRRLP